MGELGEEQVSGAGVNPGKQDLHSCHGHDPHFDQAGNQCVS